MECYPHIVSFTSPNIEYRIVFKNKVLPFDTLKHTFVAWGFAQVETFYFFGILQHGKIQIGFFPIT